MAKRKGRGSAAPAQSPRKSAASGGGAKRNGPLATSRTAASSRATTRAATKPSGAAAKATARASSKVTAPKPVTGKASPRSARTTGKRPAAAIRTRASTTGRADDSARTAPHPKMPPLRASDTVPSPPSSLDLNRGASAARTGRAELAEALDDHTTMTPDITAGDVDADVENAYFSGEEAPGGDNPTPDQDVVDEIGRALGVEYQDNEELRASEKVAERDRKRWELDPASAEDYRERE